MSSDLRGGSNQCWISESVWQSRWATNVHKVICLFLYLVYGFNGFHCTSGMENDGDANNTQCIDTYEKKSLFDVDRKLSELNPNLSKRQLKKVKKREKWLERKVELRLREREKAKQKRAFARANNIDLGPSRKALKRSTMAESSCKIGVTIDLSFDDLMIDKDIAKLTKQILRCYTLNRRAIAPLQFSLTSFNGKSKADMQKHNGYEHWDVNFHGDPYLNVFPKEKIIYLTSESENIISNVEHDCVYIIGGLVDHNSQKGFCHKVALQAGVRHGRLPLDKFLRMKARKVLTVDHVFEILLRVSEGKTWQDAFLQVLPERKNAQLIVPLREKKDISDIDDEEKDILNVNDDVESKFPIDKLEETNDVCT